MDSFFDFNYEAPSPDEETAPTLPLPGSESAEPSSETRSHGSNKRKVDADEDDISPKRLKTKSETPGGDDDDAAAPSSATGKVDPLAAVLEGFTSVVGEKKAVAGPKSAGLEALDDFFKTPIDSIPTDSLIPTASAVFDSDSGAIPADTNTAPESRQETADVEARTESLNEELVRLKTEYGIKTNVTTETAATAVSEENEFDSIFSPVSARPPLCGLNVECAFSSVKLVFSLSSREEYEACGGASVGKQSDESAATGNDDADFDFLASFIGEDSASASNAAGGTSSQHGKSVRILSVQALAVVIDTADAPDSEAVCQSVQKRLDELSIGKMRISDVLAQVLSKISL